MRLLLLLALLVPLSARAQTPAAAPPNLPGTNHYEVVTPLGRLVVRLFDETPLHRDNFKRLVAEGFYDSTYFHRVIEGFVVQGGDPATRDTILTNDGLSDAGTTVPAEIGAYHFRGALAAARQPDEVNPERASSGSQFYFVQGRIANDGWLDQARAMVRQATGDTAFDWPEYVRNRYKLEGGVPFLDAQYTVFGEVVEGLDVLEALSKVDTPRKHGEQHPWIDRPITRLRIAVHPLDVYLPTGDR
jgi:cyclophilin family peptidyl-prolyl cis-trans isomerase